MKENTVNASMYIIFFEKRKSKNLCLEKSNKSEKKLDNKIENYNDLQYSTRWSVLRKNIQLKSCILGSPGPRDAPAYRNIWFGPSEPHYIEQENREKSCCNYAEDNRL